MPDDHEWAGLEGNAARVRRLDLDVGQLCRNSVPLVRLDLKKIRPFLGIRYNRSPLLPRLEALTCTWGQEATYHLRFTPLAGVPIPQHLAPSTSTRERVSMYGSLQSPSSLKFNSLIQLRNASICSSSLQKVWPEGMPNALAWVPQVKEFIILSNGRPRALRLKAIEDKEVKPIELAALAEVSLCVDELVRAWPLVRLVVQRPLRYLSITFSMQHTTKTLYTFLRKLFKTIGEGQAPRLQVLKVCSVKGLRLLNQESDAVDFTMIGSLCSLHNLQVLQIDAPCRFRLDNTDMREMCLAWPSLRRLHLGSNASRWLHEGKANLASLSFFALHCPEVKELKIAFDAGTVPGEVPARSSLCLEKLDVGDSPISKSDTVARYIALYLARTFPRISSVEAAEGPHRRKWEEVGSWATSTGWVETQWYVAFTEHR